MKAEAKSLETKSRIRLSTLQILSVATLAAFLITFVLVVSQLESFPPVLVVG